MKKKRRNPIRDHGWKKIFLIMRITIFFILAGLLHVSASVYSQQTKLQVTAENKSIMEVLKMIEDQSDFHFLYRSDNLKGISVGKIDVRDAKLEEVLDQVIVPYGFTYEIEDRTIVIRKSKTDQIQYFNQQPKKREITGTVKDSKGLTLPGVTVVAKGTTSGMITDEKGQFKLNIPANATVLVFSFVGMETRELQINSRTRIDVVMEEAKLSLDEVVVIGYGTVKKQDLTGSVGQVQMTDMKKAQVFTFTEALAGRVAGMEVYSNDGQPGNQQNIVIRGSGSLTQSTAPLYVIDGFAMEDFQSNSLNPDDIESITVLKDASGTAIYGARGSNGVIVIETKKGKVGKPVINLNVSRGIQNLRKQMEMMSPYDYVKTQMEMSNSLIVAQTYLINGKTLDSYKNAESINWQDLVFRQGTTQTYNLSISGGSEQTRYSVSGVFNDQEALMINSGYNRYLGRFSLDQNIGKRIKIGFNANYSTATSSGVAAASNTGSSSVSNYIFANVYGYRPVTGNEVNLEEELFDPAVPVGTNTVRINPVITAQNTYRKTNISELIANAYFTYSINRDLTLNIRAGNRKRTTRGEGFYNSLTPQGSPSAVNTKGVNGNISFAENNTWSDENTLTYQKTFNSHKLTAMGGFSFEGVNTNTFGNSVQQIPNEQLGMYGLDEGTPLTITAYGGKNSLLSTYGRLDYNYKSKYLVTFTTRADGSSKFRPGNRWGYFPSVAFAWNMAEENLIKSMDIISNSKLRLSYGVSGNNRIGNYDTYNSFSFDNKVNGVSFNNGAPSTSAWLSTLGNESLKWETIASANIGYDLGLFKNKIRVTADLYRKTTNDLLLDAQIPFTTGYSTTTKNVGKIKNEGLELSLNTLNIQTPTFKWESNFNISFNRSKVLALTESQTLFSSVAGSFSPAPNLWIAKVGQPISVFNGFVFDGVYQYEDFDNPTPGMYSLKLSVPTNGNTRASILPGDIKYKDLNGDGIVNDFDQTVIGRPEPIHIGGFSNNFSYKGLSMNVFFQWSYGNDIFNGNRLVFEGNSQYSYHTNQFASWADRWSPENPTNKNFRVGGQGPTARGSSRVVEDGSYLRLKTVSLNYQIPVKYIKKFYLKNLVLSASAQNLFTWTNYSGLDPEVSVKNSALTRGFDYSAYPNAQTVVFGLNATF